MKRRGWKPSGEGATQTPPAQSEGHMRSREHQSWAQAFPCTPWDQASLALCSLLAVSSHTSDKGPNGFPQTQLHTSGTSRGFSERAEASVSLTTHPPLEGLPSYSCTIQLKPQMLHGDSAHPGDREQGQHRPADPASPSVTYHGGAAVEQRAADLGREVDAHVEAGGRELPAEGGVGHHPQGGHVGAGGAQGAAESCTRRDPRLGPGPRARASVTRGRGAPGDCTATPSSPHSQALKLPASCSNDNSSEKNR